MFNFLFLAGGLLAGFTAGWFMALRYYPPHERADEKGRPYANGARSVQGNIVAVNKKKRQNRAEKKKKILAYLVEHGSAKNDDIEKLLSVSDATATRYMDELEKEGKVIQKGKHKAAYYELKLL